ncbi:hypothetical protein [Yinghuangia soli]|uniref:Uncharacterized protein n=1 Tax=Yinghuangia soli TaxID=2908204 RepID=A0AA41Q521_9ACTN|nr:hypothetical protein [Yinghuangia soli]MCF2531693.1 hypothetical protein [Yinghuangia soli]
MTDRFTSRLVDAGRLPDDYPGDPDPFDRVMTGVRRRRRRDRLRAAAAAGVAAALVATAFAAPEYLGLPHRDAGPAVAPRTPTPAPPGAISGNASFGPWWVRASACPKDGSDPAGRAAEVMWPPIGVDPSRVWAWPQPQFTLSDVRCLVAHAGTSRGDVAYYEDPALPLTFADGTAFTGYRPTPDEGEFLMYGIAPPDAAKAEIRVDGVVVAVADTARAPEAAGVSYFAVAVIAPAGASVVVQGLDANGAPVGRARTEGVLPGTFPGWGDPEEEAKMWAEEQQAAKDRAKVPPCPQGEFVTDGCVTPEGNFVSGSGSAADIDAATDPVAPESFGYFGKRSQGVEGDYAFGRLS